MKRQRGQWRRMAVAGSLSTWFAASAAVATEPPGSAGPNRFGVSGRFLFNVSADFLNLSTPANPGAGPGVHGADHLYDNGYVKVDDSGNVGNQTWNWGFQDQTSVAGNTLQLQTVRSPADGLIQHQTDAPQYGFEVHYGRVLTRLDLGTARPLNIGLLGAFGLTFLNIRNDSTLSGATTGVMDTYDLSGLPLIPNAPYAGGTPVPGGPLPLLIPDAPAVRTPINVPATATERMHVDGQLYGFKLGPFFELPVSEAVSVQVQGGFAALLADGRFNYSETVSTGGASAAGSSKSEWRYGGFAEGQLSVAIGKGWSAFAGAGWQDVGDYSLSAGAKAVRVKLDNVISTFVGLSYSF